jgi:hypothetical protein
MPTPTQLNLFCKEGGYFGKSLRVGWLFKISLPRMFVLLSQAILPSPSLDLMMVGDINVREDMNGKGFLFRSVF